MKKLMLHVCCAPCAGVIVKKLMGDFEVVLGWVDGNIWPKEEWEKRRGEVRKLGEKFGVKVCEKNWEHEKWREFVKGMEGEKEGGKRCERCFEWRLREVFELAKEEGCEIVGTSLGISVHKNSDVVLGILKKLGEEFGMEILEKDWSGFWEESCEMCREEKWHRQNYCGCEFSLR